MAENQQILLVDDDVDLRDEMRLLLPNYQIRACDAIGAALELSAQQAFSAYVLNFSLPDGSGFGLCQKIRVFDANTPIIAISIHDSESYRKYTTAVGTQGFWTKNEDLSRLKHIVENCVYEGRVRSFEAKHAEFEAIREELELQRSEDQSRQADARQIKEECRQKRSCWLRHAPSRTQAAAGPIFLACGRSCRRRCRWSSKPRPSFSLKRQFPQRVISGVRAPRV